MIILLNGCLRHLCRGRIRRVQTKYKSRPAISSEWMWSAAIIDERVSFLYSVNVLFFTMYRGLRYYSSNKKKTNRNRNVEIYSVSILDGGIRVWLCSLLKTFLNQFLMWHLDHHGSPDTRWYGNDFAFLKHISAVSIFCMCGCSFQGALYRAGGGSALDAGQRSCVQVPHPSCRAGICQRRVLGERHRLHPTR